MRLNFEEITLKNQLHIIMYPDKQSPVVSVGVMYHVGSKNDPKNRSGFAHFFEHLLFEGTLQIPRGSWFDLVSSNGGENNAFTTDDVTYYYENFPSNKLELALWMEAERMHSAVINEIGVQTQKEVVKEEKKQRVDNKAYGMLLEKVKESLFTHHPYKHTTIGKTTDINQASLDEFRSFYNTYVCPNNAVLVIAGDIQINTTKKLVETYFAHIPQSPVPTPPSYNEPKQSRTRFVKTFDKNIHIPAVVLAFKTPKISDPDCMVLKLISNYLSEGKSSLLYQDLVDQSQVALDVASLSINLEDHSIYLVYALPLNSYPLKALQKLIFKHIQHIQNEAICSDTLQKLKNIATTRFFSSLQTVDCVARSLATYHTLYKNADTINQQLELINSISAKDIQRVANTYLNKQDCVVLDYLPESER